MTPKEKAIDLIEKYADSLPSIFYNVVEAKNYHSAKRCALIAVNEIIDFMSPYVNDKETYDFWDKVKIEIQKL